MIVGACCFKRGDLVPTTTKVVGFRRSFDRGMTWSEEHATKIEETEHPYPDPFCAEGPWRQLPSGKVYLFKRVDHRFAAPVFGDELSQLEGYTDQYDRMVLYETTDEGRTIRSLRTLGGLSQMYPAMLRLADG